MRPVFRATVSQDAHNGWLSNPKREEESASARAAAATLEVSAWLASSDALRAQEERSFRRWHWFVAASLLAAAMAWSRTYLSVHWATDTIAGTCLGVAIALLAEAAFEGGRHEAAVQAEREETPESFEGVAD